MTTSDNDLFLRYWWEINHLKMEIFKEQLQKSNKKWFPYSKGGGFRKWYGLEEYVVNWLNDGQQIKNHTKNGVKSASIRNEDYYFIPGITWSSVTSGMFSARYLETGHLFDSGGSAIFPEKRDNNWVLALMNSKIMQYNLEIQNPTLNFQTRNIGSIPIIDLSINRSIINNSDINIQLSKKDWDSFETSRNFMTHPFILRK